jgi:hypothetical protein
MLHLPIPRVGGCEKYFNIQKNIRSFLSRRGRYIGRKTPSLYPLSRRGQNVFLPVLRP